jgi:hypothetical protein
VAHQGIAVIQDQAFLDIQDLVVFLDLADQAFLDSVDSAVQSVHRAFLVILDSAATLDQASVATVANQDTLDRACLDTLAILVPKAHQGSAVYLVSAVYLDILALACLDSQDLADTLDQEFRDTLAILVPKGHQDTAEFLDIVATQAHQAWVAPLVIMAISIRLPHKPIQWPIRPMQ